MDYERKIRQLEQELGHLKVLQAAHRAHLDVHDEGFEAVSARFDRIEKNLEQSSAAQLVTQQNLGTLVELLIGSRSNGHGKEKPGGL